MSTPRSGGGLLRVPAEFVELLEAKEGEVFQRFSLSVGIFVGIYLEMF